jgi:hypothetical protein
MSRMVRPSMRVLGGLVVCCVLGLAAACSDSNDSMSAGEAAAVESAPPAEDPGTAPVDEPAPPADEPGVEGEIEEAPAPEEGAASPEENAPVEAPANG